ncbi:MAG: hypothetical protein AAFX76_01540 [Planctomycetota bacterium]
MAQPGWPVAAAGLAAVWGLLLLGNIATYLLRDQAGNLPSIWPDQKLDFDAEASIPAWYSSSLLLIAGALAVLVYARRRTSGTSAWRWLLLGVLLAAMSLDETVSVHEAVGRALDARLDTTGMLHFAWLIVAWPLLVVAVFVFGPWLWRMERPTGVRLWVAAVLYFGGAVGMEMVGGLAAEHGGQDSLSFFLAYTVEESLEILGLSLGVLTLAPLAYRAWTGPGSSLRAP